MSLSSLRPTEALARAMGKPRAASGVPWSSFAPAQDELSRVREKAERVARRQARFTNAERDLILARLVLDQRG